MSTFPANAVQSLRCVGSKKGYPYFAFGVYVPVARRDGKTTYRLVASGVWVRSDVNNRTAFGGVPIVNGIRYGSPVPDATPSEVACEQVA